MLSNKKPLPGHQKTTDDSHPYGVAWLDSYYQETLLPNHKWQPVHDAVCDKLAERVHKQFDHAERKQVIFDLLGQQFVQKYYPQETNKPQLIEPPQMATEVRRKLQLDAQNWLQNALSKVLTDLGCQRPVVGDEQPEQQSAEMRDFMQHTAQGFKRNLDRHLFLQEQQILKDWEAAQWDADQEKEAAAEMKQHTRLRTEAGRLQGILRNTPSQLPPPTASSMVSLMTRASSTTTANVKGAEYGATEDPPWFWGTQSNSLGEGIAAILKRDPRRYAQVSARLHGRQLPGNLRQYIWLDGLLKPERDRLNEENIEKVVRARFGKSVSRGVGELRIKRATHSPISGLIDNAVIEIYDKTPGMRVAMGDNAHMREAAKALNILYVYDRSYEPYLVHWLFPLQIAFQEGSGQGEHMYDLAMYLDLLNKGCFPKWPQIFAVAEGAMNRLSVADPEFYDHLELISSKHGNIDPKEFLVQLIHQERTKAAALLAPSSGKHPAEGVADKELLANPRIFVRKWVGEGFVSVLDTQAALYVWDQCFLQKWSPRVMEDAALVLLLLLRNNFINAVNYHDMRQVFLRSPCRLYTSDIQKAWIHVQSGGSLTEVEPMNRQRPKTAASIPSAVTPQMAALPQKTPTPSLSTQPPLPPVGLKNLRLKLVVPVEVAAREQWMSHLQADGVKLLCSIYFGGVKLRSKPSTVTSILKSASESPVGDKIFLFHFVKQKFVFDDLDPSEYDLEQEMGGYPYAIMRVDYNQASRRSGRGANVSAPITLGWARIKLFQHRVNEGRTPDPSDSPWVLLPGDHYYTVTAGIVSNPSAPTPTTPRQNTEGLISNSSQLGALTYDPFHEPLTPAESPMLAAPSPVLPPVPPGSQTPPQTPKDATPANETPKPATPKRDQFATWDLYMDAVTNIPDNATIIKVTGRLIKTGALQGLEDILALPQAQGPARCPTFSYRLVVNQDQVESNIGMVALLRIYTIDRYSRELVVIGSGLFEPFDEAGKLKEGGHKLMMHSGMPDLSRGLTSITQASHDKAFRIPACLLHFRVLRHTEEEESAPAPHDPSYALVDSRDFSASDKRVIESFAQQAQYPQSTQEMATYLQNLEGDTAAADVDRYLLERLDQKKQLPPNQAADDLDINRLVMYRQRGGIAVQITRAYGLPENSYIQCFAKVTPGPTAQSMSATPEGYGTDDKFVTLQHDINSLLKAPRWLDEPKVLHPHVDALSFLLIQVFGLEMKYTAHESNQQPGTLTDMQGGELKLEEESSIGWAAVPLFDGEYVWKGEHQVPLFKGRPDTEMLATLSERRVLSAIRQQKWTSTTKHESAWLKVAVWDGHFGIMDVPGGIPVEDSQLEAVGKRDIYKRAEADNRGRHLSDVVVDGLAAEHRAEGVESSVYQGNKTMFLKLATDTFYNLMESALMDAGYGPL